MIAAIERSPQGITLNSFTLRPNNLLMLIGARLLMRKRAHWGYAASEAATD